MRYAKKTTYHVRVLRANASSRLQNMSYIIASKRTGRYTLYPSMHSVGQAFTSVATAEFGLPKSDSKNSGTQPFPTAKVNVY